MQYPPILIVGPSGSGKSSSLRNLPKQRTRILNIERKLLPFKEALKFGDNNVSIPIIENPIKVYMEELDKSINSPNIDIIVHESFTAFSDELLKFSKKINKGYDIYNYYADRMIMLLDRIKSDQNKWHVVLAIDELVEFMAPSGVRTTSRRCGVNGQKLEGKIEKEFTVVFFTEVRPSADKKSSTYHFLTNNDGTTSAKSPAGMFKETLIDNDIRKAIETMIEYWGLPKLSEDVEPLKIVV